MQRRRCVLSAAFGLAALLLAGNSVKAQGYFIGYYYPETKQWSAPRLGTGLNDHHKNNSGMWNPVLGAGTAPTTTSTSMRVPVTPTSAANVRVIVPESQAQVWFGAYQTKSTGTERVFQTPALQPGSYNYTVKVSFNRDGQQLALERTITVTPGQTVVLDFATTQAASE